MTVTSSQVLISLEQPTTLVLTSDPPEALTVLRIVGQFSVTMTAVNSTWVLALIVQDQTWTPSAAFATDADKRILWSQVFDTGFSTGGAIFSPTGVIVDTTAAAVAGVGDLLKVDIAPKVKIQSGQALFLVAYEIAGASSFTTGSANMRVLYQRSGRR